MSPPKKTRKSYSWLSPPISKNLNLDSSISSRKFKISRVHFFQLPKTVFVRWPFLFRILCNNSWLLHFHVPLQSEWQLNITANIIVLNDNHSALLLGNDRCISNKMSNYLLNCHHIHGVVSLAVSVLLWVLCICLLFRFYLTLAETQSLLFNSSTFPVGSIYEDTFYM